MSYKMIQLTNPPATPFGAVAINGLIPLGTVTHRLNCNACNQPTFTVTTSGANTVSINDAGYYRISFSASVVATAAGIVTLNLVQNGVVVYSVSETATAAGDTVNLSFVYVVRALPNFGAVLPNLPLNLQIVNAGTTALTSGTSNLLLGKVAC